jgi:hypothetical protein
MSCIYSCLHKVLSLFNLKVLLVMFFNELLSRVVYGGSCGVLLHSEPILEGHTLHHFWQVLCGP